MSRLQNAVAEFEIRSRKVHQSRKNKSVGSYPSLLETEQLGLEEVHHSRETHLSSERYGRSTNRTNLGPAEGGREEASES